MNPTYTLHKLSEGFIVTSNEQAKEGELGYINFQGGDVKIAGKYFADVWKKVIAQQDQIDFSSLSEEEQKEIGWFDVEKLAIEFNKQQFVSQFNHLKDQFAAGIITGWKQSFQKVQSLLSDRRFTLEDIRHSLIEIVKDTSCEDGLLVGKSPAEAYKWIESYIQSLSQKSWKIELEMNTWFENGYDGKIIPTSPKLTNGKIKILKLCYSK
jgi:hypothetical protein